MTDTKINPKKTTLLLLDLQNGILGRLLDHQQGPVLEAAKVAVDTTRKHGAHVSYIRAALDDSDLSIVPDHNAMFASIRDNAEMRPYFHPDHAATQVHDSIKPQQGDIQHRKIRFGTFMRGPSNKMLDDFQAKGIDTVVLGGIVTSGAVLSAVRQLADLDYRLIVLEDVCKDQDEEVHRVLVEKVFPKQATVIKAAELDGLFA